MNNNYLIRKATSEDIPFIAKTIVEAEKSMTNNLGLAAFFELSEDAVTEHLIAILNNNVDGCEFSLSSFLVAACEEEPVAALGGWLEGFFYNGIPSAVIKANLLNCVLPKENLMKSIAKNEIFKDVLIPRDKNVYQLEYSFVAENHRGKKLIQQLMLEHLKLAKLLNANVKYAQLHVFEKNPIIIKVHQQTGFKIKRRYVGTHPEIMNYLPYHTKLLMERAL